MGYTHYWRREKSFDKEAFRHVAADFRRIQAELVKHGVHLADWDGEREAVITDEDIRFNGDAHCGHAKNEAISIPWPSKTAGGIASASEDVHSGNWFAGAEIEKRVCDGDCSYESVNFPRVMKPRQPQEPEAGKYFNCCKTGFRPYDLAVTALLIIAKHHFGEKINVTSDGEQYHWADAMLLCQELLGYGAGFRLDIVPVTL